MIAIPGYGSGILQIRLDLGPLSRQKKIEQKKNGVFEKNALL